MHDPKVVAFDIRRPWPEVRPDRHNRPNRIGGAFWYFEGLEIYWPSLITVWHNEPGGADSGDVCKWGRRSWYLHVHHWSFQFHPWQKFKRWAWQKCEWCGGPSRKGDMVNVSNGWELDASAHFWESPAGRFHRDCIEIDRAHRACICAANMGGPWQYEASSGPYGLCATCSGFRQMNTGEHRRDAVRLYTTALLKGIPRGERNPQITAEVEAAWTEYRELEGQN